MNETQTRAELIDPKLKESGWGVKDILNFDSQAIETTCFDNHKTGNMIIKLI